MNKIILDVFGADHPEKLILGAAQTVSRLPDISLVLTGPSDFIRGCLYGRPYDDRRLLIVDAPEIITNDDSPALSVRGKKNSSIVVGMEMLKNDPEVIGIISAGNTGAVLCASALVLGRLPGVQLPCLAALLPTASGKKVCLLDCGANVDLKPEQAMHNAVMGYALMKALNGISDPKVAVVSIGTEDKKGNAFSRELFRLLKDKPIRFVGNMEARDALSGDYDVLVADGFVGNVLLKSIEGAMHFAAQALTGEIMAAAPAGTDLSFVKKGVGNFSEKVDFRGAGGIMLGAKGLVVKTHGSADERTVFPTVLQLLKLHEGGCMKEIYTLFNELEKENQ